MKLQSATILVVEDDPNDQFLIKEALREAGADCPIHVVGDGVEAIAQFRKCQPNVTLIDEQERPPGVTPPPPHAARIATDRHTIRFVISRLLHAGGDRRA